MHLEDRVIYNIKKLRKERGLSQEQLAEKCETSTSYIGLVETKKKIPRLKTIETISKALSVDPLELFKDPDSPTTLDLDLKNKLITEIDKALDKTLHSQ